jgi:hypothetical protein
VFEEVTVRKTGRTVQGPRGAVAGVMVGGELHDDGSRESKTFAPGYGEFRSTGGGDLEAMALAVPTEALAGPVPRALRRMLEGALAAADGRAGAVREVGAAWAAYRRAGLPPRLVPPTDRAVRELRRERAPRRAAIAVAQAALDLQLRYRPPAEIDRARLGLWARQVQVDAAGRDVRGVDGDVATLEWIRDRISRSVDRVLLTRIGVQLNELRSSVGDRDLRAAARTAAALRRDLG